MTTLAGVLEKTGPLEPPVAVGIALACAKQLGLGRHLAFGPAAVETPSITVIEAEPSDFFLAPEQILGGDDALADVWSLGMTLYAMLAGHSPFADLKSRKEVAIAMRVQRIAPIQRAAPWTPPNLARLVHAMLLPADRRATMDIVIDVLSKLDHVAEITEKDLVTVSVETRRAIPTMALLPKSGSKDAFAALAELAVVPEVDLVGTKIAERYEVEARIGQGGMAVVYEASDLMPEHAAYGEVAIKVMHADAAKDTDAVQRFLREARAASKIESPYVAKVLDTGKEPLPYFVMERLRGRDLATVVRSLGALNPGPILALFLHAAEGLAAAHALGIVHRDVKPSNLFVHELADETVVMKVCDFGIAKVLTSASQSLVVPAVVTGPGGMLGSPLYMSPEQAINATDVDVRSDVFSLALSLHEALSGLTPWNGRESMGEILAAVCTEDMPLLGDVAPWLDPGLSDVVAKALRRPRGERHSTITELANALRPFALVRPIEKTEITPHASRGR